MGTRYDLIIIGAGPAGITAAIYAARKGMRFMIIAREVGGQLINNSIVDNYTGYQEISGAELISKFEEHLKEFNFTFNNKVSKIISNNGIFSVESNGEKFESRTLIISTGAVPRQLNVKGEKEYLNKGVTYCATCDGPLFRGKDIAVAGGGNSALETVIQMASIAEKIYIIDIAAELLGDPILLDKIRSNPKIEIFSSAEIIEISGSRFVEKLELRQQGEKKFIDIQGVFINIGYMPQNSLVKGLVKLNSKNEIITDKNKHTSTAGIFAAGDCTDSTYKQIITSAGEGAIAALSAFKYLAKS